MIWSAYGSGGLVIEPFSVPSDLAARGLTGQVVASKLLDRLVAMQQQTAVQEKQQELLLGNTYLGLANGDFGAFLQSGWRDYGSVSAIDVGTGKRVWKFTTPEPERGGPTTTAGGVGFVGGGDGVLRAFDVKTGNVLFKFQTGRQIASGPSVYTVNGKEYVVIEL